MSLPAGVVAMAERGPAWAEWVDSLPRASAELMAQWDLAPDGGPGHGHCSLVQPVRRRDGSAAVLKLAFPDEESEHEHLALTRWHGVGAVELLRADPHRRALLLERLHTTSLADVWDLEACEIVAGLYGRLHVPADGSLRRLPEVVLRQAEDLARLSRDAPVPRRLVEQAISLARDLGDDPASAGTLIHTDLHYENVLAGDRAPWLAIDPKPLSGDPHYEVAPMLWNRFEELAGRVREGIRQRFLTIVDAAGLDEDRARDWTIVRMIVNAASTCTGAAGTREDHDWVTSCVAIAKAVQD